MAFFTACDNFLKTLKQDPLAGDIDLQSAPNHPSFFKCKVLCKNCNKHIVVSAENGKIASLSWPTNWDVHLRGHTSSRKRLTVTRNNGIYQYVPVDGKDSGVQQQPRMEVDPSESPVYIPPQSLPIHAAKTLPRSPYPPHEFHPPNPPPLRHTLSGPTPTYFSHEDRHIYQPLATPTGQSDEDARLESLRHRELAEDPNILAVEPYQALCRTCGKWIPLDEPGSGRRDGNGNTPPNGVRYSVFRWSRHARDCSGLRNSNSNASHFNTSPIDQARQTESRLNRLAETQTHFNTVNSGREVTTPRYHAVTARPPPHALHASLSESDDRNDGRDSIIPYATPRRQPVRDSYSTILSFNDDTESRPPPPSTHPNMVSQPSQRPKHAENSPSIYYSRPLAPISLNSAHLHNSESPQPSVPPDPRFSPQLSAPLRTRSNSDNLHLRHGHHSPEHLQHHHRRTLPPPSPSFRRSLEPISPRPRHHPYAYHHPQQEGLPSHNSQTHPIDRHRSHALPPPRSVQPPLGPPPSVQQQYTSAIQADPFAPSSRVNYTSPTNSLTTLASPPPLSSVHASPISEPPFESLPNSPRPTKRSKMAISDLITDTVDKTDSALGIAMMPPQTLSAGMLAESPKRKEMVTKSSLDHDHLGINGNMDDDNDSSPPPPRKSEEKKPISYQTHATPTPTPTITSTSTPPPPPRPPLWRVSISPSSSIQSSIAQARTHLVPAQWDISPFSTSSDEEDDDDEEDGGGSEPGGWEPRTAHGGDGSGSNGKGFSGSGSSGSWNHQAGLASTSTSSSSSSSAAAAAAAATATEGNLSSSRSRSRGLSSSKQDKTSGRRPSSSTSPEKVDDDENRGSARW